MGFDSESAHFHEVGHLSKNELTQIEASWLIREIKNYTADLSIFALARDPFKHIKEEVPTHYSKVGRISGCMENLCIPQTPKVYLKMLMRRL